LLPSYDHAHARSWRHLDHGDWFTRLHARIPRVTCLWHGIRHTPLPWALAGARYTIAFERHAIDVLRETDVLGGARLLYLSWDEAWHIMERAVSRGQQRKGRRIIPRLGVDEKAVAKGHCYVTVVCDLDQSTVEYVADNRRKISLDTYYRQLSPEQLAGIEAVAMDMWDPFIASTREHVPQGENKIVFDRYHIMKHVNEAVDAVRKWEHRRLQEEGDNTLTGSKHLWLFAEENLPEDWEEWFSQLRAQHLKTGRAWALKEALRVLWSYQRRGWAQRYWQRWYFWATHSQLPPMVDVARMLKVHLDNIMTYFAHRITNATSEGLNSKIQTVKKTLTATAIGTI
jgi:transposase